MAKQLIFPKTTLVSPHRQGAQINRDRLPNHMKATDDPQSKRVLFVSSDASCFQPIEKAFRHFDTSWKSQCVLSLADGARLLQRESFHALVCDGAALAAADAPTIERLSEAVPAPFLVRWGRASESALPNAKLRFEGLDMGSSVEEAKALFR